MWSSWTKAPEARVRKKVALKKESSTEGETPKWGEEGHTNSYPKIIKKKQKKRVLEQPKIGAKTSKTFPMERGGKRSG